MLCRLKPDVSWCQKARSPLHLPYLKDLAPSGTKSVLVDKGMWDLQEWIIHLNVNILNFAKMDRERERGVWW